MLPLQPQGWQELLSQVVREIQGKKSGLNHWAVRGNLTTLEIKGRREGRISEETLLLAGQLD